VARTLNALPKYVASTTLSDPAWANTTVLPDVGRGVRDLKASGEGELNVQGSSNLLQTLQREGLVDEYRLWTCPVVLGRGKRLFGSGSPPCALDLVETRANSKGAVYAVYRAAGPPVTGSFPAPDLG
jgi:dihydrofolate reductase